MKAAILAGVAVNLGNAINLGGNTLTLPGTSATTLGGVISGTGALVKNGSSNLTLGGANTFSGGLTLNAGTLTLATAAALGTGGLTVGGASTLANTAAMTLNNGVNLGADLPPSSLADAMTRLDARIVWVSMSTATDAPALGRELASLVEAAAARHTHVVVGGRAATKVPLRGAPNLYAGSSMAELAAFARGLRANAPAPA